MKNNKIYKGSELNLSSPVKGSLILKYNKDKKCFVLNKTVLAINSTRLKDRIKNYRTHIPTTFQIFTLPGKRYPDGDWDGDIVNYVFPFKENGDTSRCVMNVVPPTLNETIVIHHKQNQERTYEFDSTPEHLIPTRIISETETRWLDRTDEKTGITEDILKLLKERG